MKLMTDNKIPIEFIIDDEDFEIVSKYSWKKYPSSRYVQASINGKTTSISRLVMRACKGVSIDHINGNRLDNRKCNLRICSQTQNIKNRKPNKNGKSSYKGVIVLPNGKFRVKIDSDRHRYELGVYDTEHDAVIAYNAGAKILHGEFAYMNEIPEYEKLYKTTSNRRLEQEGVMRPPEPPIVTLWRNTPPGIPRCCHTCTFYSPEGFCSEFEAVPPEDHAATLDACESWESEDGIPI